MAADWMVLVLVDRSGMEEEEEWEEEEKGRDACHGCCSRRRTDDGALRVPQMKAAVWSALLLENTAHEAWWYDHVLPAATTE